MSEIFDYQDLVPFIAQSPSSGRYRLGVVQSVQSNYTITCTVAGSTTALTGVKYLASTHPAPGKPVWLVTDGRDVFAFGVIAGADRTFSPRASRSTDQSIPDSTDTAISFDGVNGDTWSAWSAGQAQRLTARITGRYMAVATATFAANGTGFRSAWIERTGTTTLARVQVAPAAAGAPTFINVTAHSFDMTAGTDYVRLIVRQNSGGALSVTNSSTFSPALSLIYLGP